MQMAASRAGPEGLGVPRPTAWRADATAPGSGPPARQAPGRRGDALEGSPGPLNAASSGAGCGCPVG